MAVQPLSPATDRWLGEPLPHQLSNQTRAHLLSLITLTYLPCNKYVLYGISTSFPVLSRYKRQVAHALLTRPPLSWYRSTNSVRLECVMHAASVNPEPGSNSRLKSFILACFTIFTVLLGIVETGADTYFYVSFLVLLLVLSYLKFLCTISSLFNFQGSDGAFGVFRCSIFFRSHLSAWTLYHFQVDLSTLFLKLFSICSLVTKHPHLAFTKTSILHHWIYKTKLIHLNSQNLQVNDWSSIPNKIK